jgi:hypothetical protein
VPAEQVGLITEGGVHLTLNRDEAKRLRNAGPPGAA